MIDALTRRMLRHFLAIDLLFKPLVLPAYHDMMGFGPFGGGSSAPWLAITACVGAVWFAAIASLVHKASRALAEARRGDPEALVRASATLRLLPARLATAWTVQWISLITILTFANRPVSAPGAVVCFLGAMLFGPPPIAHSLTVYLIAPARKELALAARRAGVPLPVPSMTLARRLAFYSLCVCLAPTFYVVTIAFSGVAREHLVTSAVIHSGAVAAFAVVCAALLAVTITDPIAEMGAVLRKIARDGDTGHVGRVPTFDGDEIGALGDVINGMIDRLEETRAERTLVSESLADLARTLEGRVEERTAELGARNADMRRVLDNVSQGLVTLERTGAMSSEHSAALAAWFGPVSPGELFHEYLGRKDERFGEAARLGWDQVLDDLLPLEVALDQLPASLAVDGRHYAFSYQPIGAGDAQRFLVVVTDATSDVERGVLRRERTETLALLERMIGDRAGVLSYLEDSGDLVGRLRGGQLDELADFNRALHTLKGNSLSFGLETVGALCHELESRALEERRPLGRVTLAPLAERWDRLTAEIEPLVGRRAIELTTAEYDALLTALGDGTPRKQIVRRLRALRWEPIERRLEHLAEHARDVAQQLGKPIAASVTHDGMRVDPRHWSKLWSVLSHAVRNAVDHGIESAAERLAAGKPETGQLSLRARHVARRVVLEIEDDGRGIPWDAIRRRGEQLGLRSRTRAELEAILFADGVSTAAEVTEISGRGVGMGALREAVAQLGGVLEIWSEARRGTRMRITVPITPSVPVFSAVASPGNALGGR
jgi:two-component system chemotaxis sensor kinase CheA